MKEIYSNLFIGNDEDCDNCTRNSKFSIVHACQSCHRKALNYANYLPNTHPNYLTYENGEHLFLNIVDMYDELLTQFMHPIVKATLSFIESRIQHKKILIHCNFGSSRSPSLGLIYLAHKGIIPNNSYMTEVILHKKQ